MFSGIRTKVSVDPAQFFSTLMYNTTQMNYTKEQISEIYTGWFKKLNRQGTDYSELLIILIRASKFYFGIEEEWMNIKDFEKFYEISNFGRVKSIERKSPMPRNGKNKLRRRRELILKLSLDKYGYYHCKLYNNGKSYNMIIHQLVWFNFNGQKYNPTFFNIDHIDGIKINNKIDNFQILNIRDNISKGYMHKGKKLPIGVTSRNNKFISRIQINKKSIYLGTFSNIVDAQNAYNEKRKTL